MNKTWDCEQYLFEHLFSKEIFNNLEQFYFEKCKQYWLKNIQSSTIIEWELAQIYFSKEVIWIFFWCNQLKYSISELQKDIFTEKIPELIKNTVQSKIRILLYDNRKLLKRAFELWDRFYYKYRTDLFINILVAIDSTYRCSYL